MAASITFGTWLKRRRRQLDITQKELAYQAGCSVGTIRKIEADARRPVFSTTGHPPLSQHLDIPAEEPEAFIAYARAEPVYLRVLQLSSNAPTRAGPRSAALL